MLAIPATGGVNDDRALLRAVAGAVIAIHRDGDGVAPEKRLRVMEERLRALEAEAMQKHQTTKGTER